MIFRALTEKSWETAGEFDEHLKDSIASLPAAAIGLRMFLAVVTVLFFLLITAYASRMVFEDWRPGPEPWLLWLNTAFLILSSIAMQWATNSARREQINNIKNGMIVGGIFAFAFMFGQIVAWWQLARMDYFDITNPAIAFFYMITALHAVHILGGIVAWARTISRMQDDFDIAKTTQSVELCTIYWHYLLAVWLVLFGLLFAGNENFNILLALSGFR